MLTQVEDIVCNVVHCLAVAAQVLDVCDGSHVVALEED